MSLELAVVNMKDGEGAERPVELAFVTKELLLLLFDCDKKGGFDVQVFLLLCVGSGAAANDEVEGNDDVDFHTPEPEGFELNAEEELPTNVKIFRRSGEIVAWSMMWSSLTTIEPDMREIERTMREDEASKISSAIGLLFFIRLNVTPTLIVSRKVLVLSTTPFIISFKGRILLSKSS